MRSHASWYLKGIPNGAKIRSKINQITNIKDSETLYKNNLIELTQEPNGVVILEEDKETSLKKGDIIIKIDDNDIKDIYYYNYYLNQYSKHEKVKITIKRNNKEKTILFIMCAC